MPQPRAQQKSHPTHFGGAGSQITDSGGRVHKAAPFFRSGASGGARSVREKRDADRPRQTAVVS